MKCKKCNSDLDNLHPRIGNLCLDCFAEEFGEVVEKYPISCPIKYMYGY